MAKKMTAKAEKNNNKPAKHGNIYLAIFSVVLAFAIWIIMAITVFPETTVTLKNVPIDFSLDGSYADVSGMTVMKASAESVNLIISGERYLIGDYTADDIKVGMNVDAVRETGTYDISLVVTSVNGDAIDVVEIEPATIKVNFDTVVTKTFSVDDGTLVADISSLEAADGYLIESSEIVISPSSIEISGPEDYINQITSVAVEVNDTAIIQNTLNTTHTSVVLYRGSDVFEYEDISISSDDFEVTVPVYLLKSMNLDVTLTSSIDSFDTSTVPYVIEPSSITVRSQNQSVLNMDTINLDYISINEITVGSVFYLPISESSYYDNISGIETATVKFDLEGYAEKVVTLSNSQIYVVNSVNDSMIFTVEQARITNVTLVGPEDVLEEINASDVVAEINMLDYSNLNVSYTIVELSIYVPGYDNVWAYGKTQVYASITYSDEEADEASDSSEE